jgi:hypothetical protein
VCPGEGWRGRAGLPDALRLWLWRPRLREREQPRLRREFRGGRKEESARCCCDLGARAPSFPGLGWEGPVMHSYIFLHEKSPLDS